METTTEEFSRTIDKYSARNYARIPGVVLARAKGVWVWDVEGREYLDMIGAYSAANLGHNHPRINDVVIRALQEGSFAISPHAFRNSREAPFYEELCRISGMGGVLPVNAGVETFEVAVKLARKWGSTRMGIKQNRAEIIVAKNNFHGRTNLAIAASSNEAYRKHFGPFSSGFVKVPFGDAEAIQRRIGKRTAAVLIEPIQGEGGVNIPPDGYLTDVKKMCQEAGILFILDEVQTGLGRTGKMFAFEHEDAKPDVVLLAKSLGGSIYPISVVLAPREIMDVIEPGDHGSTWGGNPLACLIGFEALRVIQEENLVENSATMGAYLVEQLKIHLAHFPIKEIRGRGLLVAIEFEPSSVSASTLCEKFVHVPGPVGLLWKETGSGDNIMRLSPPLCITRKEIDLAVDIIKRNLV